ncbi:MAG: ribosome biogenesis GTP-binding protein YsxC [Acidobacteria bacterium]|nr:ribosome biogenesis GTP-binding protein YsxC [Acidobacteriota bacterium]
MKILSAELVATAGADRSTVRGIRDEPAQIAFVGRSNVGKSSLLNALARRKIARTSAAPGKTRTANTYHLVLEGGPGGPGRWSTYLVDLPGYGYARGGDDAAGELAAVADAFFRGWRVRHTDPRRCPGVVFLLVDARHPGLRSDLDAYGWLAGAAGPVAVVATKVDKLSRAERTRHLQQIERAIGLAPVPVSSVTGEGLDELWKLIAAAART